MVCGLLSRGRDREESGGARRYPDAGDPRGAVPHRRRRPAALADEGELTLRDGVPARGADRAAQGPRARRLRDQHRAAAGQAGRHGHPASWPSCSPTGWPRSTASPSVDVAGPGFLNIRRRGGRPGRARGRRRGRGRRVRAARRAAPASRSTWSSSRPTRPGRCTSARTRWAAVGDALGRVLTATGAEVTPRVLLQRRRRPDRPVRRVAAGRGPRRADARGRLRRRVHRRDRGRGRRPSIPTCSTCPTTRRCEIFRREGVDADVRRDQAVAARLRRRLRRLLPRALAARVAARSTGRSSGCAQPAARYEADGALWLRSTDVRRRQGPGPRPVERPADLHRRRRSPTTSTSASAASTAS